MGDEEDANNGLVPQPDALGYDPLQGRIDHLIGLPIEIQAVLSYAPINPSYYLSGGVNIYQPIDLNQKKKLYKHYATRPIPVRLGDVNPGRR